MPRMFLFVGGFVLASKIVSGEDFAEKETNGVYNLDPNAGEDMGEMAETPLTPAELSTLYEKMDKNGYEKVSVDDMYKFGRLSSLLAAKRDAQDSEMMQELDSDKDGKLSVKEALPLLGQMDQDSSPHIEAKVKLADEDEDGFLTIDELLPLLLPELNKDMMILHMKEAFPGYDQNHDGNVTKAEYEEHPESDGVAFDLLDTNGDGFLNSEELEAVESRVVHDRQTVLELFKHSDSDNDGQLTHEEIQKGYASFQNTTWHTHMLFWAEHHVEL